MVRDGGRPLNAFEIINAALDISALFERRSDVVKRHTRFTSRETPERIAEAIEAAHKHLGGTSERNSFKCASSSDHPFPANVWLLTRTYFRHVRPLNWICVLKRQPLHWSDTVSLSVAVLQRATLYSRKLGYAGRLMPKLRMTIRTARGELTVVVDILTIIPGLHMVELHKGAAGDAASFYQYYSALLPLVRCRGCATVACEGTLFTKV